MDNFTVFKTSHMKTIRLRLIVMSFLQFAVWGAYLTSMGSYLSRIGLGERIGIFYAMQGIVSIFMPAIMGVIADRYVRAERLLGISHFIAALAMLMVGYTGFSAAHAGGFPDFGMIFTFYSVSVAFFMPTIALSNSVSYSALNRYGYDTVKAFPPIRTFGTVGFICAMLLVNFSRLDGISFQDSYMQFFVSAAFGLVLSVYAFTMPECPVSRKKDSLSFVDVFGLKAFTLFKDRRMAVFFIFSMFLGVSLQITNGYGNAFISSFQGSADPAIAGSWGARNANALISLSQLSETLCILMIPFFLKRFGIKPVMLIAMFAWVLRFALFGAGNPGNGVWMFVLSMIVYGVAFDFYNISGSLFVDKETEPGIRSSAQGLFMLMTNGFGATIGTLAAQEVVNHFVYHADVPDWSAAWYIFAAYALVVAVTFAFVFKDRPSVKSGGNS